MDIGSFPIEMLPFLFLVAVAAGMLDTLAGGGGLISLPALMMTGMPPLAALATNKLQGSMGTGTATFMMLKHKKISLDNVKNLMLLAFIGSAIGTVAVQFINVEALALLVPGVLLLVAIYFLFSPNLDESEAKPKMSINKYKNMIVPSIGCYDGMLGPGTGSFYVLAGVSLRGHGIIDSTAIAKALNFSTNIASLIVFLIAGQVVWIAGVSMMCGQVIGAWMGAHFLFKINPNYLRLIVVLACISMLVRYGFTMGWF